MTKAQLRQLIAAGEIESAVQAVLAAAENMPRLHQDALLLSARYNEYKRVRLNDLEAPAELERRLNQITFALLEIVKSLPEHLDVPAAPEGGAYPSGPIRTGTGDGRLPSKTPFWFSVAAFAVLLAISLLVPGWAQLNNALFKTLLALAAAGVAATLPGFLNFNVGNTLKAGGALAAFVLVFLVNPAREQQPFALTVQLQAKAPSANYPPLEVEKLEIWNKNEWLEGTIANGVADFKNLSPDMAGKTVALRSVVEYYRPERDLLTVTPDGMMVSFVPDGSLERVYGKITDPKGLALPGVVVEVEGLFDTTDAAGNYALRIPADVQKEHYDLRATATGFEPVLKEFWPATGSLNFSMKK